MFQVRAINTAGSLKGEITVLRYSTMDAALAAIEAVHADADMQMKELRIVENGQMSRFMY